MYNLRPSDTVEEEGSTDIVEVENVGVAVNNVEVTNFEVSKVEVVLKEVYDVTADDNIENDDIENERVHEGICEACGNKVRVVTSMKSHMKEAHETRALVNVVAQ